MKSALKRQSSDNNPTVGEPSISRRKLEMEDTHHTVAVAPDAIAEPRLSETDFVDTTLGDAIVLSAPDNRSDDDKNMDKIVLADADEAADEAILVSIARNSRGIVDPKYTVLANVKSLLAEHPDLKLLLKAALKTGSFGEIRKWRA